MTEIIDSVITRIITEDVRQDMPTCKTFNITMRNGRQVALSDITDKVLMNICRKKLKNLKRELFEVIHLQKECEARHYQGKDLGKLKMYSDYNIFQLTRHATIIAAHNYNQVHGEVIEILGKGEEEDEV
tara:strand:- start:136 stop:522 length:387 start_codon:yes stop_codon:yes gene_type:complete